MMLFIVYPPFDRESENLDVSYSKFCIEEFKKAERLSIPLSINSVKKEFVEDLCKMMRSKKVFRNCFYCSTLEFVKEIPWELTAENVYLQLKTASGASAYSLGAMSKVYKMSFFQRLKFKQLSGKEKTKFFLSIIFPD